MSHADPKLKNAGKQGTPEWTNNGIWIKLLEIIIIIMFWFKLI